MDTDPGLTERKSPMNDTPVGLVDKLAEIAYHLGRIATALEDSAPWPVRLDQAGPITVDQYVP
jgi:hypothetical protein